MLWNFASIASVAGFLLHPAPTEAGTKDLEVAIYQIIPFGGQPYVSIETRKEYVLALKNYWQNFDNRVPRLSPSETQWITEELGAQGERLTRALNSKEYALFSLSRDIAGCLKSLDRLENAYAEPSRGQTEMFHWLSVVQCYSDLDGMMQYLRQAGLSNGRFDGPFYAVGASLIMDALLDKVVPSAMADTMGWTISAD